MKGHLYSRGKGHFFWNPLPGDTLVLKKWLTTKTVDKFHCSLVKMVIAFKTWATPTKIDLRNLWESNSTHNIAEIIKSLHYLMLQIMTAADTEVACEQQTYFWSSLWVVFTPSVRKTTRRNRLIFRLGDTSIQGTLDLVPRNDFVPGWKYIFPGWNILCTERKGVYKDNTA